MTNMPGNINSVKHEDIDKEKNPYVHQAYPKHVKVGENTVTVNSAAEEDRLRGAYLDAVAAETGPSEPMTTDTATS
jgi:hypothetical protein